jgi:hypothetical protein
MNSIKVISVYIGKFPSFFGTVKKSMLSNKTVDWTIFTDTITEEVVDGNLRLIPYSMEKYNSRLSEMFSKNIKLVRPYKIADTKPLYALAFPEQIKGYDWWGFCDLDVIFGNIRRFLTDEVLNSSEVITYVRNSTLHGPFTIFKNEPHIVNSAMEVDYKFDQDYSDADEIGFYKVIEKKKFKVTTCVYDENGNKVHFIRYGKRRTPARLVDGELLMDTYLEDFNQTKFGPYTNQSMLIHVRKHFVIRDDVIFDPRINGDVFEEPETMIVNNCKYETNKVTTLHDVCVLKTKTNINTYYHIMIEYIPTLLNYIKKNPGNIKLHLPEPYEPRDLQLFKSVVYDLFKTHVNVINESHGNVKNLKLINSTIINSIKSLDGLIKSDFETLRSFIPVNIPTINKVSRIIVKRGNRYLSKNVVDYLVSRHGFRELQMESFSIAEQSFLFNSADIILGTHGAGLTNMIFCKNGATVIEVNAGYNCGCYPHVRDTIAYKTESVNIQLYSIFGDSTNNVLKRVEVPPTHTVFRYRELDRYVREPMRFNYIYKTAPNEYSYIPKDSFVEISKNEDVILDIDRFKATIDIIINNTQQHT